MNMLELQDRRFGLFNSEKKPKDKLDLNGAKEFVQIHVALSSLGHLGPPAVELHKVFRKN